MVTLWSKQICLFLYLMFYFLLRRFVAATTMQLEWLWWLSLPFSVVAARLAGWGVSIQYSVVGIQSGGYSLYKAHSLAQVSPSSTALIATSWLFIEPQVTKYTTPHQTCHKLPNTRTRQLFQSWELHFRSSAIPRVKKMSAFLSFKKSISKDIYEIHLVCWAML